MAAWRVVGPGAQAHGKIAAFGVLGIAALAVAYPGMGMVAAHLGHAQHGEDGIVEALGAVQVGNGKGNMIEHGHSTVKTRTAIA